MNNQERQMRLYQLLQQLLQVLGLQHLQKQRLLRKINAPTIPIVCPRGPGTLTPDSLINSRAISKVKISNIIGNGTLFLDATIANKNSVGISS